MNTNTSSIIINKKTYNIIDVLGEGTSSTAYLCLDADTNAKCIVKEYDPKYIEHTKNEFGSVDVIGNRSKYSEGLSRFIDGANRQREIRNVYPNSNVDIIDCVEANNTAYIIMSFFSGASYDTFKEDTLFGVFSHIKAILVSVEQYHKLGFLHLDLKPSNVFILDGINDLVHFFDFDSIVSKSELANSGVRISYTYDWAAPELVNYRYIDDISERTDIYSIGEILFFKIFGRHSKSEEKRSFSEYNFDEAHAEYFDNIDSDIKSVLKSIFRKSICVSGRMRYSSCAEFVCDIDKALEISNPKRVYVKSSRIAANPSFIGREKEMSEIRDAMQSSVYVSLSGYGGIGKTELAKTYLINNVDEFRKVLYVSGDRSWYQVFFDIASKFMINYSDHIEEEADKRFNRILHVLRSLLSTEDIIFVDNVSEERFIGEEGEIWKEISALPCRFLFTSRETFDSFINIQVDALDEESLMNLFCVWSNIDDPFDIKSDIEKLFELVGYHTLAVELLAKQILNEGCTVQEKCNQIIEKGITKLKGKVAVNKDQLISRASVFDHMNMLFSLEGISKGQASVLLNAALLPVHGIKVSYFRRMIEETDDLDDLISRGWIKRENNRISMHPLISEVVIFNLRTKIDYTEFVYNVKCTIETAVSNMSITNEERFLYEGIADKLLRSFEVCDALCAFFDIDIETAMQVIGDLKTVFSVFSKFHTKLSDSPERLKEKAKCLLILSSCANELDKLEESKEYASLLIEECKDHKNSNTIEAVAEAYSLLANYYIRKDEYDIAKDYIYKSEAFMENTDISKKMKAEIMDIYGALYKKISDFDRSEKYYKGALDLYNELGSIKNIGAENHNLSKLYFWNEDYVSAQKYNDIAIEKYNTFYGDENNRECATPLFIKYDLLMVSEKYDDAEETLYKLLKIIKKEYDNTNYYWYDIHYKFAIYYIKRAQISKAQEEIEKFLEIEKNDLIFSYVRVAEMIFDYTTALIHAEEYEIALRYLDFIKPRVLDLCKDINQHVIGNLWYSYGYVYLRKGQRSNAIEYLGRACENYTEFIRDWPEYPEQINLVKSRLQEAMELPE